MAFPPVTQAFLELAAFKEGISTSTLETHCLMYQRNSPYAGVNEAREKLFSKGNRSIENIPPTSDALRQHVLRAPYQGGFVWSQCLEKEPQIPSPSSWGWKKGEQYWQPVWMTRHQALDACYELIRCGCKKGFSVLHCAAVGETAVKTNCTWLHG